VPVTAHVHTDLYDADLYDADLYDDAPDDNASALDAPGRRSWRSSVTARRMNHAGGPILAG